MQKEKSSTRRTLRIPWSAAIIAGTAAAVLTATAHPSNQNKDVSDLVAQVHADFEAMTLAIAAYKSDWGVLPRSQRYAGQTRLDAQSVLTTPMAYLPSVPRDPFNHTSEDDPNGRTYGYWGADWLLGDVMMETTSDPIYIPDMRENPLRNRFFMTYWPEVSIGMQLLPEEFYVLHSRGPDGRESFAIAPDGTSAFGSLPITPYDPTNGAESYGDIVRIVITEPQETGISDWWRF